MCSRRLLLRWVILAGFCILAVFFFPASNGPFTAIHGPATALRAWQSGINTLAAITQAAAIVLSIRLQSRQRFRAFESSLDPAILQLDALSVLRC